MADYYKERLVPPTRRQQQQEQTQAESQGRNLPFHKIDNTAPPLSIAQKEALKEPSYKNNLSFGRDKLYKWFQLNKPELKISQRQVASWLAWQEVHQIHLDSKSASPHDIKTTVTTAPHKMLALDLSDKQNLMKDGYNYIFVAVDLFSRKVYAEP